MKFSEQQTHKVRLHHRDHGDLGDAQLRFGGEWGVVANMGLLGARLPLDRNVPLDFVIATTEDGNAYTLCECRIHDFSLIATTLVYGSIAEDDFLQIDVRCSEISEWFLRPERIDGTVGEQLTWTKRSEHFSAEITEGGRRFTVSSKSVGSRERVGEDLIVHEYVEFSFKSDDRGFSLKEARDEATGLCALFSLLVAYPVSIVSVYIHTKTGHAHPMYFGTFKQLERDNTSDFSMQCLLQKVRLDGRWPEIFTHYYQGRDHRDLWLRLAGMQRYEGFWDFRLVGYVGLLDRYVVQRTQSRPDGPSPPSPRKLRKLAGELTKLTPGLDRGVMSAIVGLARRIFVSRNRSFSDQFAYAMAATDNDARAVIDITDEDFELIKDVRDRIAHGEPPEVTDGDFTRINVTIGKIALLLTYWTLHDLGISTVDFLGAMNATHNRLYLQASVDRKNLARATGTAKFFSVSAEKFERLESRKELRLDACFIEGRTGELEWSEEYSGRVKRWYADPPRQSGLFNWEDILGVDSAAIRFHGAVYIECDGKTLEVSSACILDGSKIPRTDQSESALS
jgi:ApeA N-terminal domain 1